MARIPGRVKMPPMHDSPLFDGEQRLAWLIRLRFLALGGVSAAAAVAWAGLVPGVNVPLVGAAVLLGVLTNVGLTRRRSADRSTDERHVGQAVLDSGALTLVLWAAGGADCPFIGFYAFPVLLAALLGERPALVPAGLASGLGLAFQFLAARSPLLAAGRWDPPPAWAPALSWLAEGLTICGVAYFALVFTEAIRAQSRARRDADTLLRLSLESLDVGLEVVEGDKIVWQNPEAVELMGTRLGQGWCCPSATSTCDPGGCPYGPGPEGRHRCQFPRRIQKEGPERIFEMLVFPLTEHGRPRFMVLYLDRTTEVMAQRNLILTERLASLGRTVQGVAHELNTPLATIQTLARDMVSVLKAADDAALSEADRADLQDSARLIAHEIERCRRLTHALLGRAEHREDGPPRTGLGHAISRAIAVVFPQARDRVTVDVSPELQDAPVPLDAVVQVLVNLLQNARDAAADQPIRLEALRDGERLRIQVVDRGTGLSPEARSHLFEPFFTTKPSGHGTGLGLYTSWTLLQGLGGELTLDDAPDGGAVASMTLPFAA